MNALGLVSIYQLFIAFFWRAGAGGGPCWVSAAARKVSSHCAGPFVTAPGPSSCGVRAQ